MTVMPDTTPADEMRAAAETLRALTTAATEDSGSTTWRATRHFPNQPDSGFTALWTDDSHPLLRGGGGHGRPPAYVSAPVGDYIAAMGPTVGALLAAWLEKTAASLNASTHPGWQECVATDALAIARELNAATEGTR